MKRLKTYLCAGVTVPVWSLFALTLCGYATGLGLGAIRYQFWLGVGSLGLACVFQAALTRYAYPFIRRANK